MSLTDLYDKLVATGLPVAYSHFDSRQDTPFVVYMETGSNNFDADNSVYHAVRAVRIELYTEKKDLTAEAKVEAALAGVPWESYETYIDTEKMYQIAYDIEV